MSAKVAVVTGAGTGIGAAIACALAQRGVQVVINHLGEVDKPDAETTAGHCRAMGVETIVAQADVGIDDDCRGLIETAAERWGRVDYLVNNAGYSKGHPLTDLDAVESDEFRRAFEVNCMGPFWLSRHAAPHMRQARGGAIVNISSLAGLIGNGSSHPYCASKAALINETRALARALSPDIRCNVICPGVVDTAYARRAMGERFADLVESTNRQSLTKQMVQPEDVAATAVFLLMDARQITGEVLRVDGGVHLGAVGA